MAERASALEPAGKGKGRKAKGALWLNSPQGASSGATLGSIPQASPPARLESPVTLQTPIGKFLAEWGWLLGSIGSLLLSGLLGYFGHLGASNLAVLVLLAVALVWWILVFIVWMMWVESPIGEMLKTAGRSCSILEDVKQARTEIMSEIHRTIHDLPEMDEETLDRVDVLVTSAAIAKELTVGLNRALSQRKWFALAEVLLWPIVVAAAFFVSYLPGTTSDAIFVLMFTFLVGYVAFMFIGLSDIARSARWGSRVGDLMGETHNGVRHQIERWAEERRG